MNAAAAVFWVAYMGIEGGGPSGGPASGPFPHYIRRLHLGGFVGSIIFVVVALC